MSRSPSIYIIAGEASGDVLGGKLIKALKAKEPNLIVHGVGGDNMQAEGLKSLFPMTELSVMGFLEVLPHIPKITRRMAETIADIKARRPDVVVTIDSPGFNKRVAKQLKDLNIPLVHYVAPTVWAYKPKRAEAFAHIFDHLLVLLPIEPPYFDKAGLKNTFVGHPLVENERPESKATEKPTLLVMPGSRKKEMQTLLPIFKQTTNLLAAQIPDLQTCFAVLPHHKSEIENTNWPTPFTVVTDVKEKPKAMAACTAGLIKSGTAALEVAYYGVPYVVTYKVNAFSAMMLRRMITTPFVNLINILLNKEVIPEKLQENCTPEILSKALFPLLIDEKARENQLLQTEEAFKKLRLGESPSPSELAAETVLSYCKN